MNNFVISGKGFLKSIGFDKETKEQVIEWVQQLRDAFIWNPYKEEPIRRKWIIHKINNYELYKSTFV